MIANPFNGIVRVKQITIDSPFNAILSLLIDCCTEEKFPLALISLDAPTLFAGCLVPQLQLKYILENTRLVGPVIWMSESFVLRGIAYRLFFTPEAACPKRSEHVSDTPPYLADCLYPNLCPCLLWKNQSSLKGYKDGSTLQDGFHDAASILRRKLESNKVSSGIPQSKGYPRVHNAGKTSSQLQGRAAEWQQKSSYSKGHSYSELLLAAAVDDDNRSIRWNTVATRAVLDICTWNHWEYVDEGLNIHRRTYIMSPICLIRASRASTLSHDTLYSWRVGDTGVPNRGQI